MDYCPQPCLHAQHINITHKKSYYFLLSLVVLRFFEPINCKSTLPIKAFYGYATLIIDIRLILTM